MKRTVLFLIIVLAAVFQLPAQQQTLYFHCKDGKSFACFSDEIARIEFAKTSGTRIYNKQIVYFKDGTTSEFLLNQIDSVGFFAPKPKLASDAMILDEKFEDYIIKGDTVSFTMRKDTPSNLRPSVGKIVASTFDNAAFEEGIVARVTSVTEDADGIVYTCEKAGIDEVYDELFYYGYGDIYEPVNNEAPAPRRAKDLTLKAGIQLWDQEFNLSTPTITVDDYSVKFGTHVASEGKAKIYIHKPKGGKLFVSFRVASDFEAGVDVSVTGRNTGTKAKSYPIAKVPLGIIATPIPIIFFKPELQLNWYFDAAADLTGTFKASMEYEGEFEMKLENGQWGASVVRQTFNAGPDEFSLSLNGWYGIGIEPKLFISLSGTKAGVGVAYRNGLQLTGNLKMDFVNYFADGSLYESVKDSKLTLSLPKKWLLTAEIGLFSKDVDKASLIFLQENPTLYQAYLLPDFSFAHADEIGAGKYQANAAMTPREILPGFKSEIGFAAFDEDNHIVDKKYVDTYSRDHKPINITTDFDLNSGHDYTIAPLVKILGCEMRADRAMPVVPGEAVDLGLSVKWSSTNVGAEHIYERGYVYQWGMTIPSENYDHTLYYPFEGNWSPPTDISGSGRDPSVSWGEGWAMPSKEKWEELISKCTLEEVSGIPRPDYIYPIAGVKVTGPNGNHIYIPANVGLWTSTLYGGSHTSTEAWYVGFNTQTAGNSVTVKWGVGGHNTTCHIRPICK